VKEGLSLNLWVKQGPEEASVRLREERTATANTQRRKARVADDEPQLVKRIVWMAWSAAGRRHGHDPQVAVAEVPLTGLSSAGA
jgi:hypothetical protein